MADWRNLERHPLSAEYADITGPAWMRFTLGMKRNGFNPHRPIVLYEGKVLDGWQRLRACIETNTEPEFITFVEIGDVAEYIQTVNDERRHESQQDREERRERVAKSRTEGKSFRTIAEEEGVSPSTIRNDIDAATAQGAQTKPKGGKVTGKDGVKRPAKSQVICRHCEHRKNVGRPLIENCPDCAELRKVLKPTKAKKKVVEPEEEEKPITDDAGTVVPIRLIPVFKSIPDFAAAEKALNVASKAFKVIEEGACKDIKTVEGARHFTKFYGTFKTARARLKAMRPSLVCSACNGDACDRCQDGFLTAEMVPAN